MEAKYYQPSIEEFHVGFEFERKSTLRKNCWVKKFFADGESAEQYCYDDEGRVKLLDREDIESLGWKYNPVSSKKLQNNNHQMRGIYSSDFKNERGDSFSLFHNISANWILIWTTEDNHTHTIWDDKLQTMGQTVFAGIVKNKSKFQDLMQMLNIK